MKNPNRSLFLLSVLMLALLACQVANLLPGATPSPTPTRTRTTTPTVVARATAPPLPTVAPVPPTPVPEPVRATANDNLRVRAAPSTSAAIVDRLTKGASAVVTGRNADSSWLQIVLPSNANQRGWISAQFATASGPLATVPIVQAPIPPTVRPYP
ncbi:MAG: SH3 domain-containing protein [Chloroflexi bacterium]|nr:SH3 domain-containing protein [Chloroflexota bacterium]